MAHGILLTIPLQDIGDTCLFPRSGSPIMPPPQRHDTMVTDSPKPRTQSGIQTKFLIGLAAILVLFTAMASVALYYFARKTVEEEAYAKAELLMTAMEANRIYVQEVLRPKMYELLDDETFVVEAMSSSFISRSVMERARLAHDEFSYRRVAIDARNPHYEANQLERKMVEQFQANPALEEWHGIVDYEGERFFMRFTPEYFTDSCLHCHGLPEDAPTAILEKYGRARGFYRQAGQIHGVSSVGLPVGNSLLKIKESAFAMFMAGIPLVVLLYAIISIFFNRFIVQNLHSLLDIFRRTLSKEQDVDISAVRTMDEIHELNDAAHTIATRLQESRAQLERYTERLLQSKELLQSVFDGITDPVILLDSNARIKTVNLEFLRRYGLQLEDVLNHAPEGLNLGDSCPLHYCEEVFRQMPDYPLTREVKLPQGEIFLIHFYPIQSIIGQVDNLICYVKDITKQKQLEAKIQQTEKLVSIGQLAAGIAHEINNPLGVILCHIDLLKDETDLSPEARQDLKIIEKHADNCRTIIADLLNFAHQQQANKTLCSINDAVSDVISMVNHQFGKSDVRCSLQLDESLPQQLLDYDKIKQVILNLLINSFHAVEAGGDIRVTTRYDQTSESSIVEVEDNGSGIADHDLHKIFDPFFTTKPPGKGTGLGLSVSYGIIKEHGGDIQVRSGLNRGTRFSLSLPIIRE